jgi:hypothetical protein
MPREVGMDYENPTDIDRKNSFRVRPIFLLAFAAFLAVITLPDVVRGGHTLKRVFLLLATVALASGWFFLLNDRDPNSAWRRFVALTTSVYLTMSVPAFLFEMSQIRWLIRHPMHRVFSIYVWPWARWGFLLVFLGVVGSFLGCGRARVAFILASVLLTILWAATGTWAY